MKNNRRKLTLILLGVVAVVAVGWLLLSHYGLEMPEVDLSSLAQDAAALLPGSASQWAEAVPTPPPPEDTPAESPGLLQVYFLDVGQGDSTLIRAPAGDVTWTMLIDTGEYAYADGLTDALKGLGVTRIDALVCSHPHLDHMGCMARIVQRFEIGALYMPRIPDDQVPTTSGYEALLRRMKEKDLSATRLAMGTQIPCPEGMGIQVLSPDPNAVWDEMNDYSGVLKITWGANSFLITGDAEKPSEQVMLYSGQDLSAQVLRLGHHGSSTSTSVGFFDAVHPEIAVISCGRNNEFGHPHREVRALLAERGTPTYRTDQDHTILITADGVNLTVTTDLPSIPEKQWAT